MTLLEVMEMTEEQARKYIERKRWPNGPICPHCKSSDPYELNGESHRPGLYKCRECGKQFTVTVKTFLHGSRVGLKKWLVAIHMLCSSRKGISALQLQRQLGIGSYETAWKMLHKIRKALKQESTADKLFGTVEADETYVGGKPRWGGPKSRKKGEPFVKPKRGRGTKKTPVFLMVERNGNAVSFPVYDTGASTLQNIMKEHIDTSARIMTDEWRSYIGVDAFFDGGHEVIRHKDKVYSIGDINTNTAESFFALVKRAHKGVYHYISKKYLGLCCNEFVFRWNHRKDSEETMMTDLLRRAFENKPRPRASGE